MLDKNPVQPRDIQNRHYRTLTYQETDRVPDIEFSFWSQTLRRWVKEGMDLGVDETDPTFFTKVDEHFGFDDLPEYHIASRLQIDPPYKAEILQRKKRSVISRGEGGVICEHFEDSQDESSIPHFLEFPIKSPADWPDMKRRFRVDEPSRKRPAEEIDAIRAAVAEGKMIFMYLIGPYGQLREWMGFENLSTAFYDYPDMIHDMVDTWTELLLDQVEQIPEDLFIDEVMWWEDMACKNGPFVSPEMFREFLQPCYHAVMTAAKKRGCAISVVDSDGNPHDIVANWLQEGVNIMFPLEVAAGVAPYAWREEFGLELRLRGGVAKAPLVTGGSAIDAELERLKPLLEQGGFIPHLDHLVPPDISYKNYLEYREKKRKLIGKQ